MARLSACLFHPIAKRVAFVELAEEAQEDATIAELDGAEWMGRQLKVNKAKPREAVRSATR